MRGHSRGSSSWHKHISVRAETALKINWLYRTVITELMLRCCFSHTADCQYPSAFKFFSQLEQKLNVNRPSERQLGSALLGFSGVKIRCGSTCSAPVMSLALEVKQALLGSDLSHCPFRQLCVKFGLICFVFVRARLMPLLHSWILLSSCCTVCDFLLLCFFFFWQRLRNHLCYATQSDLHGKPTFPLPEELQQSFLDKEGNRGALVFVKKELKGRIRHIFLLRGNIDDSLAWTMLNFGNHTGSKLLAVERPCYFVKQCLHSFFF